MIEKVSKLGLALLGMLCIPVAVQGETVPVGPISMLSQQDGQISGVVSDKAGPVIGASVIVKGTTNGITTDMDGRFSLAGLKKGDVIQISYIGYVTQEIKYTGQVSVSVLLLIQQPCCKVRFRVCVLILRQEHLVMNQLHSESVVREPFLVQDQTL